MKKLTKAIALAGVMTTGLTGAQLVQADDHAVEVAASAAVSNMYLWRGADLGNGAAAVSGDLSVSMGGAYGGVWMSSGDTSLGQEYDLYVGYGGEVEDFSYDVSAWSYVYPGSDAANDEGNTFDLTEVIVSLGFMGASFSYYYPVAGDGNDDYNYITLGYGIDAYSLTVGMHDDPDDFLGNGSEGYTHVDLGYAFNDNISFTLSKIVDTSVDIEDTSVDDDLKIAFTYSLPIDM
jgi:uncharacterized protein (TIGR02001 family)